MQDWINLVLMFSVCVCVLCWVAMGKYSFIFFLYRRMISYISIPYVRSFFSILSLSLSRLLFFFCFSGVGSLECVGRILFFLLSVGNNSEKSLRSIHHNKRCMRVCAFFFFFCFSSLVFLTDLCTHIS